MTNTVATSLRHRRRGHTLMELVVAMAAGSFLIAGLGSVMLIGRHIAYTPTAAVRSTQVAEIVNELADDLRCATLITEQQSQVLEFLVADRNADGAAEKIRYEWPGVAGAPLQKTINGTQSAVLQNVQECTFAYDTLNTATSPIVRTNLTRVIAKLRTDAGGHSRIDAAVPLIARPERLASYWRTDFDANPTTIDSNRDGGGDWIASNGATFTSVAGPGQLQNGTWYANGNLATSPANDFTANTVVEIQVKNMAAIGVAADVLQINADRGGGVYAPLILRLRKQSDGSQTLTLIGKPSSGAEQTLKAVDNLIDDYMRIRLTIQPASNQVSLQVNGAGDDALAGPFVYPTHGPLAADRNVKIGGSAKFDYVEVRVGTN